MNRAFTKRMAHGAWRMAHGAWRMAHGAYILYFLSALQPSVACRAAIFHLSDFFLKPVNHVFLVIQSREPS
jgi:hypothetical protein